jgi:predicted nuclease with TOPRIM domain
MNNIIFVAIVLAACSFACQILTMFAIRHLDEKIAQSGAFYKTVLDIFDRMSDMHKSMLENIGKMKQLNDDIIEQYKIISAQYDNIKESHELVIEQYHRIYEAFRNCEDRYSDIYEQWREMTAQYEDIKSAIDEIKPSEETDEFAKRRDMAIDVIRKAQEKVGA